MSKKYSLIINIAMIVIGIIGMLFYYMASKKPLDKPRQVQKVVQTKVIEAEMYLFCWWESGLY